MATSRTGTTRYKHWRRGVLHRAQAEGITHCPCIAPCNHHQGQPCRIRLDYNTGRRPNSAEPDHITPWANGGQETPDNGRAICRRCNQATGNKRPHKPAPRIVLKTSDW